VNRLLWKIRHPDSGERMKIMIEPIVIEPAAPLPELPRNSETSHIRISVKQEELV
jgi:hypothetical protein